MAPADEYTELRRRIAKIYGRQIAELIWRYNGGWMKNRAHPALLDAAATVVVLAANDLQAKPVSTDEQEKGVVLKRAKKVAIDLWRFRNKSEGMN